ncbi:polysaccharide biosynthesis protein [Variovorax sp. VRV01]|uniref:oligosaccharide flippase family protein n=1 Tax=Variovorax sp. VRV01 TaxID=2769259 RepID=UPI0017853637|nr:oligosaccharide flippase family protein [Variovorax sp. VRV01]MBD9663188.1 polysaccharide biosynthesis protein [Variovorax sp. VRV01]
MNLRSIVGFAFGPIASAAISIVIVPIIAWSFPPADIARLNIFQISLSFVLLLSVLGLDQAYVREYSETKEKSQLLLNCFVPGLAILIIFGGISVYFASELSNWLYAEAQPALYFITLGAFVVNYLSRFLSLTLRMEERGWAYSISQVLPKVLQLVLVVCVVPLVLQKKFLHLLLIVFGSSLAVLLIYSWNTRRQCAEALRARLDFREFKTLMAFGMPLIFSSAAYWALTAATIIMLRSLSSLDEVATYSMAANFAGAAIVFQSIFSVIWAPMIYKWTAQGRDMKIIEQISRQALAIASAIIAVSGSLSWICDWLLPVHYSEVKYILLCMLMQPLLYTLSEVTGVGIGIARRTIFSLWITLVALIVSVGFNYVLIPLLGASGAAIANSLAFFVFFLGRTEVSARIWRDFPRKRLYLFLAGLWAFSVAMVSGAAFAPTLIHGTCILLAFFVAYEFKGQFLEIIELVRLRKKPQTT